MNKRLEKFVATLLLAKVEPSNIEEELFDNGYLESGEYKSGEIETAVENLSELNQKSLEKIANANLVGFTTKNLIDSMYQMDQVLKNMDFSQIFENGESQDIILNTWSEDDIHIEFIKPESLAYDKNWGAYAQTSVEITDPAQITGTDDKIHNTLAMLYLEKMYEYLKEGNPKFYKTLPEINSLVADRPKRTETIEKIFDFASRQNITNPDLYFGFGINSPDKNSVNLIFFLANGEEIEESVVFKVASATPEDISNPSKIRGFFENGMREHFPVEGESPKM